MLQPSTHTIFALQRNKDIVKHIWGISKFVVLFKTLRWQQVLGNVIMKRVLTAYSPHCRRLSHIQYSCVNILYTKEGTGRLKRKPYMIGILISMENYETLYLHLAIVPSTFPLKNFSAMKWDSDSVYLYYVRSYTDTKKNKVLHFILYTSDKTILCSLDVSADMTKMTTAKKKM